MNDPGLEQAIRAVGGITELARRIGISQPSVSNWERVPAARVIAVEAATGVARESCGPIFTAEQSELDEVEVARAREYALLAALLSEAPDAGPAAATGWAARRCDAARTCPCRARRGGRYMSERTRSSASISICSSASGAASCCLTGPTISPASCTSVRWRVCATIWQRSGIERCRGAVRARGSRRHSLRDHGRSRRRDIGRVCRAATAALRKASRALDRAFLRRP